MRVFDFRHAIVRAPGRSVVHGLREDKSATPDFELFVQEHTAYVAALRAAGVEVEMLPPLEAFPDSVFVEDPALVMPEGAILLRPGAPSRLGEREEMRGALRRRFERVIELQEGEFADGGDILIAPDAVTIGLSKRTNLAGAEGLRKALRQFGRELRIAQTPPTILHLKTAASLLDEGTILATKEMADSGIFAGFKILVTPAGEEAAANALRVNDTVMVGAAYPRTIAMIQGAGLDVTALPVKEVAKLDAGLSCMSLRW